MQYFAVSWFVNTKNSLTNSHGLPPYQLAIETNFKLASTHHAKVPAVTNISSNKSFAKNIEAIHKAREVLVASEKSRTIRNRKYLAGDSMYFKQVNSNESHCPVIV